MFYIPILKLFQSNIFSIFRKKKSMKPDSVEKSYLFCVV